MEEMPWLEALSDLMEPRAHPPHANLHCTPRLRKIQLCVLNHGDFRVKLFLPFNVACFP